MAPQEAQYTAEEHARRGREIYNQQIRPKVEADHHARIVAIDIESGEFETGDTTLTACETLLARLPDAQIWCVRVGHPAVHRIATITLSSIVSSLEREGCQVFAK